MGRLLNGPNGPYIGKAGSYIGYVVNGIGYIKGNYKPRTKPPTEKEALNRRKFAAAQAWLKPLTEYVREGFKAYSQRSQGFIAAKSFLMRNALRVVDGEIVIDPSLVKISVGKLAVPKDIKCSFSEHTFRFSWTPAPSPAYDQIMVLAYDTKALKEFGIHYGNYQTAGEQLVRVGDPTGKTFHCYLALISADRSQRSDSVYLGKFEF